MIGLTLILGLIGGLVFGYFIGYQRGFNAGKDYIIKRKRWYDKTRK
jgi:hypothetical protein